MSNAVATQTQQSPREIIRTQLDKMDTEITAVLPEHVSLKKFKRIALTAIARSPDLIEADRPSLFAACLDCAQDGLVPDGREAALVAFNTKVGGRWIKKVQYMPMIFGVYKKVRNTGEIATLSAHVVHADESFEYWIDEDGPHLRHNPILVGQRGDAVLVYAVCRLKDSSVEIEAMTKAEVEEVRAISKSAGGPAWSNWWGEMARKTVIRRLSKRLPMSSDQERLMRRDDSMYDLEKEQRPAVDAPPRPQRVEYQPTSPAHGENLDAEHRRVTTGYIGDDPEDETESASGQAKETPAADDGGPGGGEGTPVDPTAGPPNDDEAAEPTPRAIEIEVPDEPGLIPVPAPSNGQDMKTVWQTWCVAFLAAIDACEDVSAVNAWMEANADPLKNLNVSSTAAHQHIETAVKGKRGSMAWAPE